ncbi:MAG: Gfo/Idh/MocA family oxidoreductase [Bacteroidota bacterium]|nr:Gfo/Idh/MocA family oxidoreductase [Bacteroidota bacterium]
MKNKLSINSSSSKKNSEQTDKSLPKVVPSFSERGRGEALTIGIIGAGSFAAFAANAFLKIKGVKVIAVSDINEQAGKQLAKELNAKFYPLYNELLKDKNVDLVYIATPPFLHFNISKDALFAGKHVICEKPAALKTSEAEELQGLAKKKNLLYAVNLMQRYNPLFGVVKKIIDEKILGSFLHGFFENYASDENLNEKHWFWDEEKSGGIFIEHGVHFFDLFSGWLGKGKLINAFQLHRENTGRKIYDRVQASVLYNNGVVNFYHGFDQPKILDRQEMRLQFEIGEITLYGWIPVQMKLHGLLKKDKLKRLQQLIGPCTITKANEDDTQKKVKGRFTEIIFNEEVTIESGNNDEKQNRYQQMLTDMLTDQWAWLKDKHYKRIIDDDNAIESIRMAERAKEMAQNF